MSYTNLNNLITIFLLMQVYLGKKHKKTTLKRMKRR